jgi:acetoin utilization deacetylase AcuC-like enzyme
VAVFDVDVHHGNGTQGIFTNGLTFSRFRSMPTQPSSTHSFGAMRTSAVQGPGLVPISIFRYRSAPGMTATPRRSVQRKRRSVLLRRVPWW